MAKIIEASAVISARAGDLSGIDKMAAKLLSVSKAGASVKTAMAGASADLSKRVSEISGKLNSIDNFRTMSRGLDAASVAMNKARQEAGRLKAAIDAAEMPTKAMRGEYARAALAVERATAAFKNQGAAVRDARSSLEQAGIPVRQIAATQARLRSALDSTTAAMTRQVAAGRAMGAGPWGGAATGRRSGSGVPLIQRVAPGGVVPPGVPVVAHGAPAASRPYSGVPPIAEAGAGLGMIEAGRRALTAGADVDTERSQARQAGWTASEIERTEARANALASRYGVAPGSAFNILREARPTFGGDLATTLNNIEPFFDVLTAMRQKSPNAPAEEHNRQLGSMIKAGEIMGYSSDPARLKQFADFMAKMTQVHGSALRGEEVLNFAKSGKSAASAASFEYLSSIFPTMLPELGGDRLGTASMTLRQALVGGKMKKRAAENLAELGIIDPKTMIKTDDDDVKGVKASGIKGVKLLETNPLEWVKTVLVPAMDQKGVKAEDRPAMLSTLFSDRNAEYLINLLVTQMARLEKDRGTVEKALGLPGAQQALRDDPYLAGKRVAGGLAQVGSAVSDPFMGAIKYVADKAAIALSGGADIARADPASTGTGAALGGLGGGLAALLASQGSGILLRGAAALAGGVGGGLAGGVAAPLMVKIVGDGVQGAGGIAGGKHYIPSADQAEAMRAEIAAAQAKIEGITSRLHPSRRGEFNIEIDTLRGQIADMRNRLSLYDAGDRVFGKAGELGAPTTGPRIEAAMPSEVTAKIEGKAEISGNITVSPSPEFLAKIEQRITATGNLAPVNGPGSTGRSMPEAGAPSTGSASP